MALVNGKVMPGSRQQDEKAGIQMVHGFLSYALVSNIILSTYPAPNELLPIMGTIKWTFGGAVHANTKGRQ